MRNASDRESFSLSWDLPHVPKKVWRALTESDLLEKWVMPNDLKPVVGRPFTFRQQPTAWWDGIVYGEVLEVVPEQRLSYTWRSNRREDGSFVLNTTVVWTLSPTPSGGTLLELEQSGFTPENGAAFAGAKSGWDRNVQRMIEFLQPLGRSIMSQAINTEIFSESREERKMSGSVRRTKSVTRTKKPAAKVAASSGKSASELITARIAELGDWRGDVLRHVRTLIREADPEIVEEWKWMGTPVWSHNGGVCTGESYKQVVKLTFFKGASLKDPARLFNSSLDGNVRRAIDIHEGDKIDETALKDLICAAVALNLAGKKK